MDKLVVAEEAALVVAEVEALVARVEIYTKSWCPNSFRAKAVLDAVGAQYEEYDVEEQPARETEMGQRVGSAVEVPQIFIDDKHVGGSLELGALFDSGELEKLIGSKG